MQSNDTGGSCSSIFHSKAKKPPKGPLSGLGTVYDDPAIIHVIEHAKNMADHEITPDDLNNVSHLIDGSGPLFLLTLSIYSVL